MKSLRLLTLAVFLTLASSTGSVAQRQDLPPWRQPAPIARSTAEIEVGDTPVTVELALSSPDQALGLGYRNGLDNDTGMLFVFPQPSERTFWMKGMRFCLDIVWIADGHIVGAAENACPDPEGTDDIDRQRWNSGEPVTHVLEMNAGWMAAHGYGAGTAVTLPEGL